MVITRTLPFALGFQVASALPFVLFSLAMRFLVCPPIVVKYPPANISLPLTAIAETVLFAFGFHALTVPSELIRAILFLSYAPTFEKVPPIYHPPLPSGTDVLMVPFTFGKAISGKCDVVVNLTPLPVFGPTTVKSPPIYV